jgi:hypothetical protein
MSSSSFQTRQVLRSNYTGYENLMLSYPSEVAIHALETCRAFVFSRCTLSTRAEKVSGRDVKVETE